MRWFLYGALLFWMIAFDLHAREGQSVYPHRQSNLDYRVTNRRYISHVLYENKAGRHYVTLITTHGGVWAFHASSHALHYACPSASDCLRTLKQLDQFLQSGWNLGLHLKGSIITKIDYLAAP